MKFYIMTAAVVFLTLIGASYVYAEEYTLDIPFDITSVVCNEVTDELIVTCVFQGTDPFKVTVEDKTLTPELIEPEIVEEEIIVEPEVKLTREEKEIQRMIDRITLDLIERPDKVPDADKQLLELLLRAKDKCEFGIEEGQPIQTYQIFAIPKGYFYPEDTDFSKYNMLGKITQLVEACTKWEEYKVKWLGPQYADIANATVNFVPWSPTATIPYNVTITDEFMNRVIVEHDILEEAEDAEKYKCSVLGKQRGFCPEGIGADDYVADTTENPSWLKYQRYLNDPENAEGEPRYSVSTNPKCAILSSFAVQYELDEEATNDLLIAAGCKIE